jgi:hypothetical protein
MVFFEKMACADARYLDSCHTKHRLFHQFLGFMVSCIALISGASVAFMTSLITSNRLVWVFAFVLFTFLIAILYRFLFCSLSGNSNYFKANQPSKLQLNFGDFIRFIFIGILGIFFSEPIALYVFKPSLDPLFKIFEEINTSDSYQKLALQLNLSIEEAAVFKIDSFLNRVKLLHLAFGSISWLVDLVVFILFLIPLFLKSYLNFIRNGEYERIRYKHEVLQIRSAYFETLSYEKSLFSKLVGVEKPDYELFEDPPFNTIKKKRNFESIKL